MKVLAEGKYLRLVVKDGYEMIERINCSDVVLIIPITDDGKLVLIDQFRKPLEARVIEFPAGLVNDIPGQPHESREKAARRELVEETGYEAREMDFIGDWPTSCGMTSEMVSVYLATGLKRVGEGGGDELEDINVHAVPIPQAAKWITDMEKRGFLVDAKIYGGVYFAQQRTKS